MNVKTNSRTSSWRQNPDAVRADILATATSVFAEFGLSGARIEEIVRRTKTSKRMIYYYFKDKNGLYLSVLEAAYAKVRAGENALNLEELSPLDALECLVEFTFDYHCANPDYVRLVQIENIHNAEYLSKSDQIPKLNFSAIEKLQEICRRGVQKGEFRADVEPVELHWLITSSCIFNVSHRATFSQLYGGEVFSEKGQTRLKQLVISAVRNAIACERS